MANFTVKNIPDDLYAELKRQAEENRRSLNSEAIVCLQRAVRERPVDSEKVLRDLEEMRARMNLPWLTDEFLDEAKNEGRP